MMQVKTLLIDNYDSYTYNLYQLIAEVNGGKLPLISAAILNTEPASADFSMPYQLATMRAPQSRLWWSTTMS